MKSKKYLRKRENYTVYDASEALEIDVDKLQKCDPPYEGSSDEDLLTYLNENCFSSDILFASDADWFERNEKVYGEEIYSINMIGSELKNIGSSREKGEDSWFELGSNEDHSNFEVLAKTASTF